MPEQEPGFEHIWWRFSDYEVFEVPVNRTLPPSIKDYFRYIVPKPAARLEKYKPILELEHHRSDAVETVLTIDELQDFDIEDESAILAWCKKFGLFGILPHTATSISLAPRWRPPLGQHNPTHLFPTQTQHFRTAVGWRSDIHQTWKGQKTKHIRLDETDRIEDWLDRIVDPADADFEGGALITGLFSEKREAQGLAKSVGHYFPRTPTSELDTAPYPMPLSDDFWHQYSESVADIQKVVRGIRSILNELSQAGPLNHLPIEVQQGVVSGRNELNSLLLVSPSLGMESDGSFSPRWAFFSLLAMFAFVTWQNLLRGQSLRHCKKSKCRKLYFTSHRNREYCSTRCRQSEEKARYRYSLVMKGKGE